MMGIAEMYRRSGGTDYKHYCCECEHYMDGKRSKCSEHGEDRLWKGNYVACRSFLPKADNDRRHKVKGKEKTEDALCTVDKNAKEKDSRTMAEPAPLKKKRGRPPKEVANETADKKPSDPPEEVKRKNTRRKKSKDDGQLSLFDLVG